MCLQNNETSLVYETWYIITRLSFENIFNGNRSAIIGLREEIQNSECLMTQSVFPKLDKLIVWQLSRVVFLFTLLTEKLLNNGKI